MPHVLKLKNTTQTLSLLHLFPVNFCGFDDGNKACGAGQLSGEFLLRSGQIPDPGRPDPGSNGRSGPGFKTMIWVFLFS